MIAKLLLQNTLFLVAIGALLFASAGSLHWPSAWVFLVTSAIIGPACGLWLARTDPALLAERLRPTFQADQPAADKKFMLAFVAAVAGLAGRHRPGPPRTGIPRSAAAASAGACDVPALDRLHHVGVSREFLCRACREGTGRTSSSRRIERALCLRAASHVQRRHAVLPRRAAAAGIVVGPGDRAAIRRRCSPFAPASRSARWSKACPIMLTTPRACAIVWCPDSGE